MTIIADKPFTQLLNLNLLDELRVQGVLIVPGGEAQNIIEITGTYTVDITDDFVSATLGTTSVVNLPDVTTAVKHVVIKNSPLSTGGADITLTPDGADTLEGVAATQTIAPSESLTIFPVTGGWLIS